MMLVFVRHHSEQKNVSTIKAINAIKNNNFLIPKMLSPNKTSKIIRKHKNKQKLNITSKKM